MENGKSKHYTCWIINQIKCCAFLKDIITSMRLAARAHAFCCTKDLQKMKISFIYIEIFRS